MFWNQTLKYAFNFEKFPKSHSSEKGNKNEKFGKKPQLTTFIISLLLSSVIVKIPYENCQI